VRLSNVTQNGSRNDHGVWPDDRDGQVAVMLLGTYHMDTPGLGAATIDVDDVLAPARQDQLSTVVDRLARWRPELVAVERPYQRADRVNRLYRKYRDGDYEYSREVEIEPPHPMRDETTTECRSEVVQVGFRLADRLNHDRVAPVDWPTTLANEDLVALDDTGFHPPEKLDSSGVGSQALEAEVGDCIAEGTVLEVLRWHNREAQLRRFNGANMDALLWMGEGDNYGGPRALGTWYERNLRMVHNLWRTLDGSEERVLVLVGASHVSPLRHLLTDVSGLHPVSARPHLDGT
jgi:hypothetical protein